MLNKSGVVLDSGIIYKTKPALYNEPLITGSVSCCRTLVYDERAAKSYFHNTQTTWLRGRGTMHVQIGFSCFCFHWVFSGDSVGIQLGGGDTGGCIKR